MFAWGANSYGQLSTENTEDLLTPTKLRIPVPQCIVAGGGHTFFKSDDGEWFSCGSNSSGQLGVDQVQTPHVITPTKISFHDHKLIAIIACGWDFSFLLDKEGTVYGFGSNAFGQLGLDGVKKVASPMKITSVKEKVVDIACGLRHTLLLTASGNVLGAGAARKGQLGVTSSSSSTNQISSFTPVEIKGSGKVVQIVAGDYHSAARTEKGEVLVWGDNKHGQLGLDHTADKHLLHPTPLPQQCFDDRPVTSLHSGWSHMLAQTDDGKVYSWGRNAYCQLGRCQNVKMVAFSPSVLPLPGKPSQLAVGSEHNLAIIDGQVYSWGWNEHGMCGTGTEENVPSPQPVHALQHKHCTHIACGAGHSFAIMGS